MCVSDTDSPFRAPISISLATCHSSHLSPHHCCSRCHRLVLTDPFSSIARRALASFDVSKALNATAYCSAVHQSFRRAALGKKCLGILVAATDLSARAVSTWSGPQKRPVSPSPSRNRLMRSAEHRHMGTLLPLATAASRSVCFLDAKWSAREVWWMVNWSLHRVQWIQSRHSMIQGVYTKPTTLSTTSLGSVGISFPLATPC
mmetsp:Transcript_39910/g.99863  ORF Transcript_39910/g.99863 Transcript_39910/m.99863 type:complete len:203 (+) Transcript_39910:363-971(+)